MEIMWNISQLDVKPAEGDYSDVVITAHWQCSGSDGEYSGRVYSTSSFSQPGDPFTPYADLTQEQVLDWVWASGVDKDATEAAVAAQIENEKNPPVISPALPWEA